MIPPPPHIARFLERIRQATAGTPYVVEETWNGFDVRLDLANAEWFGLFNKAGLTRTFIHHVAFPKPGVYTITDESRTVEWTAGVPTGFGAEVSHGRFVRFERRTIWAWDAQGNLGVRADYRFDAREGRDLVTAIGKELGLTQRRGAAEMTGLVCGAVALAGALVTLILLPTFALLGKL